MKGGEEPRAGLAGTLLLLTILYLMQGIPLGLAMGSVSYLLKNTMTYAEVAFFSLSAWPYSLKLFWSPLVDGFYWPKLGRRKSWIFPLQILMGLTMMHISTFIDCYMPNEECRTQGPRAEPRGIKFITGWFFVLVLLSATQDIALDGWALEILPEQQRHLASTSQTIGLTAGFFLSFTVLLSLSSRGFISTWMPWLEDPPITISGYISMCGIMAVCMSLVVLLVSEKAPEEKLEIGDVYRKLLKVILQRKDLLMVLLVHKIGFVANEAAAGLLLLDKGFRREDFALAAIVDFPVQLTVGLFVARWSKRSSPTRPWMFGQLLRLALCFCMNLFLYFMIHSGEPPARSIAIVSALSILTSISSTIMFVAQGSFFATISDSSIGGTYQTLLNTISNFGGTWPKYFFLRAIDYFNVDTCDTMNNCVRVKEGYFPVAFGGIGLGLAFFFTAVTRWVARNGDFLVVHEDKGEADKQPEKLKAS